MTDREKRDWATDCPANARAVVNGMFGHKDGPLAALEFIETRLPVVLVCWLCRPNNAHYNRIVAQVVDEIQAAESEPPDAHDKQDPVTEAAEHPEEG